MKKIALILSLFLSIFLQAQTDKLEFEVLVESEMKAAARLQSVQTNPNTLTYDVLHHELRLTVDPAVEFVSGEITTTYKALQDMTTLTFDFSNELTATSVTQNGNPLSFTENSNNELVITLPAVQSTGTTATVKIIYSGVPPTNGFDAFAALEHNGTPVMWTLSEPFGARDWWPCKQDLNDKISTIDMYVTAPSQYTVAANGLEQSQTINGGLKTTHFYHSFPIPAYLVAFAVTNYTVYTQQAGTAPNDFPIVNYFYPEDATQNQASVAVTVPIMNFYEQTFEPYPFHTEKYGHAQFGWGGGMEHTTVSFMGGFSRGLIAHELAHQWFGDKITCGTWKDIWLNEGFATYLASMIIEHLDGEAAFVSNKSGMISSITSATNGAVYLTDSEATNPSRIFSSRLSYNKGAMVLEMLRWKMGHTGFTQAIKNYLADTNLAFKYAVTSDLQTHLETVYTQSLTEFFNDWVYNQGYPSYNITYQNWGAGQIKIVVNQSQSHSSVSFFEMPIEIRLNGSSSFQDVRLEHTQNGQEFIIDVPFVVTSAVFDPKSHIISKDNTISLGTETFTANQTIRLYPNPATSSIKLQLPADYKLQNLTVFNTLGQRIFETSNPEFSVEKLPLGIHILKIETSKGIFFKNFIKE